jgi:uncharacterized protein YndB with AHSA1/START domain
MSPSTDRIERSVLLKAPRSRVWHALSNAEEFGSWFGVNFKGQTFAVGKITKGSVTYKGYEHITMEVLIERLEPERVLEWRWHPAAIDPNVDYSSEPMTTVVFELEDAGGGTRLTVVESGFDRIPPARRAAVIRTNTNGWDGQMQSIEKHLAAG